MEHFKGKGEHSVKTLEKMVFERDEKISELNKNKHELLEVLQSLENDDNSIPPFMWNKIQQLTKQFL